MTGSLTHLQVLGDDAVRKGGPVVAGAGSPKGGLDNRANVPLGPVVQGLLTGWEARDSADDSDSDESSVPEWIARLQPEGCSRRGSYP